MRVQGRLVFGQDDVTCCPADPSLSGYRDRLSLGDPALDFRLRLFGARVSGAGPTALVALVVPGDLVFHAAPADGDPEARTVPEFHGIPEQDLHVVHLDRDGQAERIAVERIVLDEMIGFARHHGLRPVELVLPSAGGEICLPLPLPQPGTTTAAAPPRAMAQAPVAVAPAIPASKRPETVPVMAAPAPRPVAQAPIPAPMPRDPRSPAAPVARPAATPPLAAGRAERGADAPRRPDPFADRETRAQAFAHRLGAMSAGLAARWAGLRSGMTAMLARFGHGLRRAVAPLTAPLARRDWHALARPAPLAAMALVGILGTGATVVATRYAPPDAALRATVAPPASPTIPASVTPVIAAPAPQIPDDLAARPDPETEAQIAPSPADPRPLAEIVRNSARDTADLAGVVLTTAEEPAPAPPAGLPIAPALSQPAPVRPAPVSGQPSPAALPGPGIALSTGTLRPVAVPSAAPVATPGWADEGPARALPALPPAPEAELTQQAGLSLPQAPVPPRPSAIGDTAPQVDSAAAPVAPVPEAPPLPATEPRPTVTAAPPAPDTPVAPQTLAIVVPEAPRTLGPDRAPRPTARPAGFLRLAEPAIAEIVASPPRPATAPVPRVIPQAPTAPAPADTAALPAPAPGSAPTAAPSVEVIQSGGASGLRVLAIVGTGTQRQALIQTGQGSTVLGPGSSLGPWSVLEVRRDGVLLANGERQRFLPFGS